MVVFSQILLKYVLVFTCIYYSSTNRTGFFRLNKTTIFFFKLVCIQTELFSQAGKLKLLDHSDMRHSKG